MTVPARETTVVEVQSVEYHEHNAPYCRDGSRFGPSDDLDAPCGLATWDDRPSVRLLRDRRLPIARCARNPESHARLDSDDSTLVHHHRTRRTGEHLRGPAEPMKNVKAASF